MLELVVTDRTGAEQGPIRGAVTERQFTPRPLRQIPTGKFTVRADNAMAPWLAQGDKTRVKVYRDGLLWMNGPVVSFEKTRDDQGGTIAVGVAGIGWVAGKRLVGKSQPGMVIGSPTALVDKSEAMGQVLDAINADGATGIIRGTLTPSPPGYFGPWRFKPALEAWSEISATDGPEWEIEPLDTATRSDGAFGRLNAASAFGTDRPDAVWEFGTGKRNVKTWRHVVNPDTVANRVFHLPAGFPDAATAAIISGEDATSRADRGLYEATVAADITVDALRQQLVAQHVFTRAAPSQIITFEPRMEVVGDLVYRTDYQEGDLIRFHALERFPVFDPTTGARIGTQEIDTVDAIFRIYAVTFTFDQQGNATPTFTIISEG